MLSDKFSDVYHIRYPADIYEVDNIGQYSDVILPLPVSKDGFTVFSDKNLNLKLSDLYDKIQPFQRLYGAGMKDIPDCIAYDFMKNSTFKFINACFTAQGTLRLMFENTDSYIIGKKALIIGFGDVATTLALMLSKLGFKVITAMRKADKRLEAETFGYKPIGIDEIINVMDDCDYIFGTVPARILTENHISKMKDDSIYIELASSPFTADKSIFEIYSKNYIFGGGLPGKYLPKATAELMADYILTHCDKMEGVL